MAAFYRINFQSAANEDLRHDFKLTDAAAAPVDLTGAALKMTLKAVAGTASLSATTANGRIVISNPGSGDFTLGIPAAAMNGLPPGSYQHDLVLTDAAGRVRRLWAGALTLEAGVTP